MKNVLILTTVLFFLSCQKNKLNDSHISNKEMISYTSFGDSISTEDVISKSELLSIYENLKENDSIKVKFESSIIDVCQKKGCWMNMDLNGTSKTFVRFKDYGFFMPLNASDSDAIVEGFAFIEKISVDELKHYAKDAGKSQEAIDSIVSPKITYAFTAHGVLIKE
jgi:hypothetical protein